MSELLVAVLGTDHHPFDRLVSWLDDWIADRSDVEAFAQTGYSRPLLSADSADIIPRDELVDHLGRARVVVTHGGPNTIMDARSAGLLPIVVPRTASRGEHVDDHQVAFSRRMAEAGWIHLAETEAALRTQLDRAYTDPMAYRICGDASPASRAAENVGAVLSDALGRAPGWVRVRRVTQLIRFAWRARMTTAAHVGTEGEDG
ncbi:hypothetical protein GCM10009676_40440 [Prauserella halophila]|uniref:Glycosyl transferase family 28 C-terminal domain-containing protein n=1 Tax=Prauserella halophila TaxID=185641 RepID=A0ABP4H6F4_9PSEU|nr:glycosyltransferase [Prauserella halophila]MCP2236793.1 UDP-N-acetylglucosamine transferase subunit ALG13 [Prauserella halophila]